MKYQNAIIGIWGYGRVGKAAAVFLRAQGASLIIYDEKPVALEQGLKRAASINELLRAAYLLPSPGVDTRPYRTHYQGTWLTELDLFQEYFKKPIIAITGSVGKTTVTHLITQALSLAGLRVQAAGNIGLACLSILEQQEQLDAIVLEVSSFQLEYVKSFAPTIAVWTTLTPNHLDRHASMEEYFNAKYNLIRFQTDRHHALIPSSLAAEVIARNPHGTISWFCMDTNNLPSPLFSIKDQIIGVRSAQEFAPIISLKQLDPAVFPMNWLIVYAVVHLMHMSPPSLSRICPIAHRLERVATFNDATFYNDSKSTTPASTLAALTVVRAPRTILFLGGLSKGVNRSSLIHALKGKPIEVLCFGHEAPLLYSYCIAEQVPAYSCATLEEAFDHCMRILRPNDCVLFSPAGSSFDLFENYEKRGEQFKALVLQYAQHCSIS